MKQSDYNKLARTMNLKEYTLSDNEFVVIANYIELIKLRNKKLKEGMELNIGGNVLKSKYNECQEGYWMMSTSKSEFGFYVVPDHIVDNYKVSTEYSIVCGNYNGETEEELKNIDKELTKQVGEDEAYKYINTKVLQYSAAKGMGVFITFIGLYLGIVFLVSCVAILSLKSLSESTDNKKRYEVLRKIGADEKMINAALCKQIGIGFVLPLLIAGIHSVPGMKVAKNMLTALNIEDDSFSLVITALIIVLIYGGYFVLTFISGKNIVNDKT